MGHSIERLEIIRAWQDLCPRRCESRYAAAVVRTPNKRDVRAAFRTAVFERDGYTCVVCGRVWSEADADPALGRVNAHHILDRHEFPNGGYVAENGVTVCDGGPDSCHGRCERFHASGGREHAPGLHPEDLYRRIGSSLDAAIAADEALGA